MWYFTFQYIDFFGKYLIKNGENDISELLDFKLSWGSMPLDPNTRLAPLCSLRLLWKSDLRPMQMFGEHEKTYTPLSCLLSQNDKGRLDLPTNGVKKALYGRDWVVMESLHHIIKWIWQRNIKTPWDIGDGRENAKKETKKQRKKEKKLTNMLVDVVWKWSLMIAYYLTLTITFLFFNQCNQQLKS